MRKIIKIFALIVSVGFFFIPMASAMAPIVAKQPPEMLSPQELIEYYASPKDVLILKKMINCESHNKNYNVWGKDGEYGIAQFMKSTFYDLANDMGMDLEWKSQVDQIKLLSWVAENEPNKLRQWTSYVAIINGGEYTFNYRGKKFTFYCK